MSIGKEYLKRKVSVLRFPFKFLCANNITKTTYSSALTHRMDEKESGVNVNGNAVQYLVSGIIDTVGGVFSLMSWLELW